MLSLAIPTQITFSLYVSLLATCLLTFMGLSLRAPATKTHYVTLIVISIIFIYIPLRYGRQFSCINNLPIPVTIFGCFYKMLIWLKRSKKEVKDTPPFFWTLF